MSTKQKKKSDCNEYVNNTDTSAARSQPLKFSQVKRKQKTRKKTNLASHVNSDELLAALKEKINIKREKEQRQLDRKIAKEICQKNKEKKCRRKKKKPVNSSDTKKIKKNNVMRTNRTECKKCGELYVDDDN